MWSGSVWVNDAHAAFKPSKSWRSTRANGWRRWPNGTTALHRERYASLLSVSREWTATSVPHIPGHCVTRMTRWLESAWVSLQWSQRCPLVTQYCSLTEPCDRGVWSRVRAGNCRFKPQLLNVPEQDTQQLIGQGLKETVLHNVGKEKIARLLILHKCWLCVCLTTSVDLTVKWWLGWVYTGILQVSHRDTKVQQNQKSKSFHAFCVRLGDTADLAVASSQSGLREEAERGEQRRGSKLLSRRPGAGFNNKRYF